MGQDVPPERAWGRKSGYGVGMLIGRFNQVLITFSSATILN